MNGPNLDQVAFILTRPADLGIDQAGTPTSAFVVWQDCHVKAVRPTLVAVGGPAKSAPDHCLSRNEQETGIPITVDPDVAGLENLFQFFQRGPWVKILILLGPRANPHGGLFKASEKGRNVHGADSYFGDQWK